MSVLHKSSDKLPSDNGIRTLLALIGTSSTLTTGPEEGTDVAGADAAGIGIDATVARLSGVGSASAVTTSPSSIGLVVDRRSWRSIGLCEDEWLKFCSNLAFSVLDAILVNVGDSPSGVKLEAHEEQTLSLDLASRESKPTVEELNEKCTRASAFVQVQPNDLGPTPREHCPDKEATFGRRCVAHSCMRP